MIPRYYFKSAARVTPDWLAERGAKAVIVDLDNTLLPRFTEEVPAELRVWIDSLHAAGIGVVLLSNNHRGRVGRYARLLSVIGVANAVKPLPFGFLRALRALGTTRHETVMVGDQFFTDMLGAALLGLTSVMVLPLSKRDLAHTLILRKLEGLFMRQRQAQ
ncbi:MAG: YqeG family HAD IIIA-type phosphatase [Actinomycetia bacterium]|nr:YqeG family HAD IIIA-type phosphatase [Actinomycetes bacterium]